MALLENEVNPRVPKVQSPTDTLTFVTTEGEQIVFEGMDIPGEEAAALMGEEALGRIWNRPAEDDAWRGIQKATSFRSTSRSPVKTPSSTAPRS